jgi:hypothetical protein
LFTPFDVKCWMLNGGHMSPNVNILISDDCSGHRSFSCYCACICVSVRCGFSLFHTEMKKNISVKTVVVFSRVSI